MKKRGIQLFFVDISLLAIYWGAILISMEARITGQYGEYQLFEDLALFRPIVIPLVLILVGGILLFKDEIRPWPFLALSAVVFALAEGLGAALAAAVYGISPGTAADMLRTSLTLLLGLLVCLLLWAALCGVRAVGRAMGKKRASVAFVDAQAEYEQEHRAAAEAKPAAPAGPEQIYQSSPLVFVGYWLWWLFACTLVAFFIGGAIEVYLLKTNSPGFLFAALGVGALASVVLCVARGHMRVVSNEQGLTFYRWGKLLGSYSYRDYVMSGVQHAHLLYGIIPLGTDRSVSITDKTGYSLRKVCRNFSQETYVKLMDDITQKQRALTRRAQAEKQDVAAARPGDEGRQFTAPGVYYKAGSSTEKLLPMPGEDDFVSLAFTVNKGQLIKAEQERYGKICLGLLLGATAMYALWYFLLYRTMESPMESLPLLTLALIAVCIVIVPMVVMLASFNRETKCTPVSILVENDRLVIDMQSFALTGVRNLKMTNPQAAKAGTASHRMHLTFAYMGKKYNYTIGSGTVKNANFPDYRLLYNALDAQRAHARRPAHMARQRRMQTQSIRLSPHTVATILVPFQEGR